MALLYYNPLTFSSASFVVAHVTGTLADKSVVAILVDLEPGNPKSKHKVVSTGADYRKIAPRGAVPVLDIPGKVFLDENVSVLLHLADAGPKSNLLAAPPAGTPERALLEARLAFIASEIHSNILWLLRPIGSTEAVALAVQEVVASKLEFIFRTTGIASGGYLTATVTVADLYLNAIIGFLGVIGVAPKLAPTTFAGLKAYSARVEALPEISAALAAIGSPTKPPQ